jgi:uncharacterized membrane protein YhaH (DUF805 family)
MPKSVSLPVALCGLTVELILLLPPLLLAWKSTRGTTLRASWWWAIVSFASLTAINLLSLQRLDGSALASVRFVGVVSTFCPALALFGAKRPQDRGWQFIVFSLLLILCWPALNWLLRPGAPAVMHAVPASFLLILVLMELVNYVGTRFFASALTFGLAQVVLLFPYLPWQLGDLDRGMLFVGGCGLLGFALASTLFSFRAKKATAVLATSPVGHLWTSFRDAYGVVWAMRVMERMNALAKQQHWGVQLTWDGFADVDGQPLIQIEPQMEAALLDAFRNLLRRFVSPEWIDAITPPTTPAEKMP